jgi:hypothetical protein
MVTALTIFTKQLLVVLVNVAGDHDLQVLPVIDQADGLALAARFGELVVSVPVHSAEDGTLIAALDGNECRVCRDRYRFSRRDRGHRSPLLSACHPASFFNTVSRQHLTTK